MDQALFQRIIEECAGHQGEVERLMLYLMNEPLLDPNIAGRINLAKELNPNVGIHILTNGSLLTERRGDALLDSALDWMGISVHGYSEEAYKEAMGLSRDVTYGRVERFVKKAIARRGPEWLMITFNGGGPVTGEERESELRYFRDLGVKRISYFGVSISRAGNVPHLPAPSHSRIQGCNSIWWPEMMHILFNGDVILCCMDWQRRVVLGNLMHQSMEELWHSAAYGRVRETVAGQQALSKGFPCERCEEAIVEQIVPMQSVDVGVVVLPCAVMDSDASTVPGVQAALRSLGVSETESDLSDRVYRRMDSKLSPLWHRAGHGVVNFGDGSEELLKHLPGEAEYCVDRSLRLQAEHLLFFLCRVNSSMTLEVVRRIKERDPGQSILVYGTEPQPTTVLHEFGVPYCRHESKEAVARWVAASIGREVKEAGEVQAQVDAPTPVVQEAVEVKPPWRPPEWEGTGAGMVPPLPGEDRPSPLSRWLDSIQEMARVTPSLVRSPLLTIQELRRQARQSADALLGLVMPQQRDQDPDAPLSGVPGTMPPRPEDEGAADEDEQQPTMALLSQAAPEADPPEPALCPPEEQERHGISEGELASEGAPPPPKVPETPWQNRPDAGRPMDLLLATTPPWGYNNPPTSLAHLATYTRSKGYGVEVLDLNVDLYHRLGPEWQLLWHVENKNYWSHDDTFRLILELLDPHLDTYADLMAEHPAPLLGFSVVDPKERCTIELIRRIKERCPDKHILLGGPACVTPEYRQVFVDNIAELIDGYAMGEGEALLCEAIEAVKDGQDLSEIPGILCHQQGDFLPFKRRKRIDPLDQVPFPLYEDFLVERYPGDELIVEWSRGCIGSCSFCKGKMIDGKYRIHSAEAIYGGMRHYSEWLGLNKFTVCDPVINGDMEVMEELCRLILDRGLEIQWRGEAIPHQGLTTGRAQLMRQAGCTELQLGLESGSDTVLKLMKKHRMFSVEEAAQVLRDCHDAGIRTALFIIIGFPGEGEQEFMETFNFINENAEYIDELKSINSLHIITDTPIHIKAEKYGLVLPERDYHYKWSTTDGENTLEVRNQRIRRLKDLAGEHQIFVRETNLAEGKHHSMEQALNQEDTDPAELMEIFKQEVNAISSV